MEAMEAGGLLEAGKIMEAGEALERISRGTEAIIGKEALAEYLASAHPLTIKFGVDPTRPDLTFGHLVVFHKLRQFQDLGHRTVLLIGDYTATIGDPSGRSATRPILSSEEVERNAETYLQQAFRVLDSEKTSVRRNSEWFAKMSFDQALGLARKMTVARMLERDDFQKRHREGSPISIVEFLYPLIQGYDSVMLESDVEIGGSDQLFNMLVGRGLQREAGLREQVVIGMPLLVGLDGVKKMSKSGDNYIAFNDSARDMFGKLMSIPDTAMESYYRLLLGTGEAELRALRALHPMEMKKRLATRLVAQFFDEAQAAKERAEFEAVFSQKALPENMPCFRWEQLTPEKEADIVSLVHATGLFPSRREVRRLQEQRAIRVNGGPWAEGRLGRPREGESWVVQVGRRQFFRIEA
jgi:tyrosyl-tRNA synthetase